MTPEEKRAKHAEEQRSYRARHRDERKVADRAYYRANKAKWKAHGQKAIRENGLVRRSGRFALRSNRRAEQFGVAGVLTSATVRTAQGPCFYCSAEALGWDHMIPMCRGGTNSIGNIVPACTPCNRSKGKRTPEEWRAGVVISQFAIPRSEALR